MMCKKNMQLPLKIKGLSFVAEQYSGLLIDAWGVLHDGRELYPGVLNCLQELHERNIAVVVISNAARRASTTQNEIIALGVDPKFIHQTMTSGEVFWQSVNAGETRYLDKNQVVYYLGPARSRSVLRGLHLTLTEDVRCADIIVTTGCVDRVDSLDNDLPILQAAVEHDIPMLCVNPDLLAIRSGVKGYSAGALAEKYRELGATDVRWIGKPHQAIYTAALSLMPASLTGKVLAIGDAIRTDICGARDAGLDSLLICGGIHHDEFAGSSAKAMRAFFNEQSAVPTYYTQGLCWS